MTYMRLVAALFVSLLFAIAVSLTQSAYAEAMDDYTTHLYRRDATLCNIINARSMLATYELELELAAQYDAVPDHLMVLNKARGDILYTAAEAYRLAGPREYPQDPHELAEMLNSLTLDDLSYLQWPESLHDLVDCGILPHLPPSPHETGEYLTELPTEDGQPGDVYYEVRPTKEDHARPAGRLENYILLIFDQHTGHNHWDLYRASTMGSAFRGDITLYIQPHDYADICYISGEDLDTWFER